VPLGCRGGYRAAPLMISGRRKCAVEYSGVMEGPAGVAQGGTGAAAGPEFQSGKLRYADRSDCGCGAQRFTISNARQVNLRSTSSARGAACNQPSDLVKNHLGFFERK
jgi:hypothetical protein